MIGFNCVHQPANTAPSHCSPLLGGGGGGGGGGGDVFAGVRTS